jgi:hypothetical protein
MTNTPHIHIPRDTTPVHLFDVWGPIVDSINLGAQKLAYFDRAVERFGLLPEAGSIARKLRETILPARFAELGQQVDLPGNDAALLRMGYDLLSYGDQWVKGAAKRPFVKGIDLMLRLYEERVGPMEIDYQATVYPDAIKAITAIMDAGEAVSILSSGAQPWLVEALGENITDRLGAIYVADKSKVREYRRVYDAEMAEGRRPVSFTSDEFFELENALETGIIPAGNLVLIDRIGAENPEKACGLGMVYLGEEAQLTDFAYV